MFNNLTCGGTWWCPARTVGYSSVVVPSGTHSSPPSGNSYAGRPLLPLVRKGRPLSSTVRVPLREPLDHSSSRSVSYTHLTLPTKA